MIALFFMFSACETDSTGYSLQCDLAAPALAPAEAAPGESIVATGNAFTEVYDTVVTVGGEAATIIDLERADCVECDECQVSAGCTACDDCDACATECLPCVETLTFSVPTVPVGWHPVTLTNLHGQSAASSLLVTEGSGDTGDTGDTGVNDSGDTSTGDSGDSAAADSADTAAADSGDTAP